MIKKGTLRFCWNDNEKHVFTAHITGNFNEQKLQEWELDHTSEPFPEHELVEVHNLIEQNMNKVKWDNTVQ